jgi:soluble lytic murein transglycosylase-like protein
VGGILIFFYAAGIFPPQPPSTRQPVQSEITYEAMFREVGQQYGLDWRILACQAYYESRFDPLAVGVNQDAGLMQILPGTWNEWAPQVGVTDPYDPYSNLLVSAAYLAFLQDYFAEQGYTDERWMLVAYNWGPYNLQQFLEDGGKWTGVPKIRRHYALNILRAKDQLPPAWEGIRTEPVMVVQPFP